MANSSLIGRMLHTIDAYEAGNLSSEQVEQFIEFHMGGLENISCERFTIQEIYAIDLLSHIAPIGEDQFIDAEHVSVVLAELRRFLLSLPGPRLTRRCSGPRLPRTVLPGINKLRSAAAAAELGVRRWGALSGRLAV